MKNILVLTSIILLASACKRKAYCSCVGDTTSETYKIKYKNGEPHPLDQCKEIEANSTDNFTCVFRG